MKNESSREIASVLRSDSRAEIFHPIEGTRAGGFYLRDARRQPSLTLTRAGGFYLRGHSACKLDVRGRTNSIGLSRHRALDAPQARLKIEEKNVVEKHGGLLSMFRYLKTCGKAVRPSGCQECWVLPGSWRQIL